MRADEISRSLGLAAPRDQAVPGHLTTATATAVHRANSCPALEAFPSRRMAVSEDHEVRQSGAPFGGF